MFGLMRLFVVDMRKREASSDTKQILNRFGWVSAETLSPVEGAYSFEQEKEAE